MNYTRTNNSDTNITIALKLDTHDLASVKPKTLARLARKMKVQGFRPGKVPASVAEKNLDPNTLGMEVAEDAINNFMAQVLETEKIMPLDRPQVDLKKYVPGEQLECEARIEILPAIKLGDYKKLKAKKQVAAITDEEIAQVIDRMRQGFAEKTEVDRPAKLTDEVWIDFAGTQDGKPVAGASGTDYPLALGSNTFIPGFEEGLVGKKAGETFDLPLTFPQDYQHQALAGAQVNFKITVKKVKAVTLPEVTDEFAAKCGPFKTVAELKADITRELTDQKEREALDKLKDDLIEQLVKGSHIPTPEILITDQIASLERDFVQNLMYRGMTLDQYLQDQKLSKDAWREKELRPQAIRRVQVGLALAELGKAEDIQATTAELNERLAQLMQQYGNDAKIREQFDTPEARRDIANRLITEKTVDRLVEINTKD